MKRLDNGIRIKKYKMGTYKQQSENVKEAKRVITILAICMIISFGCANNEFSIKVNKAEAQQVIHPQAEQTADVDYTGIAYMQKVSEVDAPRVEEQIRQIAEEKNFKYVSYLIRLARCESKLNPKAINNKNKNGSIDWGLFQWNSKNPPMPMTKDCAMDIRCSTEKTIEAINAGMQNHWTCDKLIK